MKASLRSSFYEHFLEWQFDGNINQIGNCFSINFGHHDSELPMPRISLGLDSEIKPNLNQHLFMNALSNCFIVLVSGNYMNNVNGVFKKVKSVTNGAGVKLLAMFFISPNKNFFPENSGLERQKSGPVMVNFTIQL